MPLQVRAISLPFLACAVLQPGGGHAGPVILDLRGVRLMAVARQFVRAIATFERPDEPSRNLTALSRQPPGAGSADKAPHPPEPMS